MRGQDIRPTELLFVQPNASAPAVLKLRKPFPKPSYHELIKKQHDDEAIIKFAEGTGIRLRGTTFAILESELDLDRAIRFRVSRAKLDVQIESLNDLIQLKKGWLKRMFSTSEEALRRYRLTGEALSARELPDLDLFFQIKFPGSSPADVANILYQLNQFEIVEYSAAKVKVAPPPVDISPTTPHFTAAQNYFAAAPMGIDVSYARQLPGGRGESIRIIDVEYGWFVDHEDFPALVSTSGANSTLYRDHGTAVVGEIAAAENAYGMTGIAPLVEIGMASPILLPNLTYNLPDAIQRATDQSRGGDIILVEQQVYYNYPDDQAFCPSEWDPVAMAAIETSVANGRIVILAAGNGGQNLDDQSRFGTWFDRNVQDSGAVYVGAAASASHEPLAFTNYGSRVDLHGWGENIATLGYGDLFFPDNDVRQSYTSYFGGTSGATPIVTGSAALLQAIRRARGLADLTSHEMRSALQVGATPQGAGVSIGPMPDLRDAIIAIPIPAPVISATGAADGSSTISWNGVGGVTGYEVFRKDSFDTPWNLIGSTSLTQFTNLGLSPGSTYLYRVRAYEAAGNRSADSNADLATLMTFTDAHLSPFTVIRAEHIIEARIAVNAICTFAGTTICGNSPFSGAALDESSVRTALVNASDLLVVQSQIAILRAAIGASPATFRETPTTGMAIRALVMEDLRLGVN